MALLQSAIKITARANDLKRRLTMPKDCRAFLLRRGVEAKTLVAVAELDAGWQVRYSDFREAMTLEHADVAGDFGDKIAKASFIGYGVADEDGRLDVYAIDPTRRDVIPPTATNVSWKVYMQRVEAERYSIPPSA